jgi:hypothetical protein
MWPKAMNVIAGLNPFPTQWTKASLKQIDARFRSRAIR